VYLFKITDQTSPISSKIFEIYLQHHLDSLPVFIVFSLCRVHC